MSGIAIFVGAMIAVVMFIIIAGFGLLLYCRGKVVRVLADAVSYFVMKSDRALRLSFHPELIITLTPKIEKVLDALVFSKPEIRGIKCKCGEVVIPKKIGEHSVGDSLSCKCGVNFPYRHPTEIIQEAVKNDGISEEVFKWWLNVKTDRSKFQIWCYRFTRPWKYFGIKGRTVYCYCLYPLEEMMKKIGRREYIIGKFLPKPIDVYAPNMEEWTDDQLKKLQKNELSAKVLESINKSYSFFGKEPYLATMFFPTLTVTQESEFSDRIEGMGNWLKTLFLKMADIRKLAEFDTYKQIADNAIEERRIMAEKLHNLGDVVDRETDAYQALELAFKESKIPFKISTTLESLPSYRPQKEKGSVIFQKVTAKVKNALNPVEVMAWILLVLGAPFSIIAFVGGIFSSVNWAFFLIATMMLILGVVMMYWRYRNEPMKPKSKEEVKSTDE